jgi:hypothetical protein
MPKRKLSLKVRIPEYKSPRNAWRLGIHEAVLEQQEKKGIKYHSSDKLQVIVKLYLRVRKLLITDVDNRLKDILDALQGRAGGPKNIRSLKPIIPNDNQVYNEKNIIQQHQLIDGHS